MGWKFKDVRTLPGTKHGPVFLAMVRSCSLARMLPWDCSTVAKGEAKEDEDVESRVWRESS